MRAAKKDRQDGRSPGDSTSDADPNQQGARQAILTRRARFMAAALASAGLAGAGAGACACLSMATAPSEPATVNTDPTVGASNEGPSAGGPMDAGAAGDAGLAGDGGPPGDGGAGGGASLPPRFSSGAQICLSDEFVNGEIIKKRIPRACLDFDPATEERLLRGPRPDICLEAPFDDGTS
jgi:hypothetical protein